MNPTRIGLFVTALGVLALPLRAAGDCGGFAMHGDPLFGAIDAGIGGRATVLHDPNEAQACVESAACVEEIFPIAGPHDFGHDDCPFDFGANADDAKRLSASGARAATFDGSCFLRFALTASSQHRREFVPAIKSRLHDPDARAAMAAALAMRDLGAADAATWRSLAQYWYPPVRELARAAGAGTDADLLDAPQRSFYTRVEEIGATFAQRWCDAQPASWHGMREPASDEDDEDDTATIPLAAMGLRHEQGWPVCGPQTERLAFAGGTLIGSNRGEWGGSAYFFRAPELPRPLLSDNVQGARADGDRVALYASLAHLSLSESRMYRIAPDAQRVPRIVATIEFPEAAWRAQWHGAAMTVVGWSGIVYELGPDDAHPQVLGCARHARGFYAEPPLLQGAEPFGD